MGELLAGQYTSMEKGIELAVGLVRKDAR